MQVIPVNEQNIDVETITSIAEEAFGMHHLTLVGANYLKIEDSESTKSMMHNYHMV